MVYMKRKNLSRPLCINCSLRLAKGTGKYKDGSQRYGQFCTTCQKIKYEKNSILYKRPFLEKVFCFNCGFIPEHICQLDVDHIDGNRKNNEINNLQILCANCHRLKTFQKKDWTKKGET